MLPNIVEWSKVVLRHDVTDRAAQRVQSVESFFLRRVRVDLTIYLDERLGGADPETNAH